MAWIISTLTAAFLLAVVNTADKFFVTAWIKPRILLLFIGVIQGLTAVIAALITGLDPLSPFRIFLALGAGFIFFSYIFLVLTGIKGEEVSRVLPILYVYPILVLILSVLFLGETLTSLQYFGVGAIMLGAIGITLREDALPHINKPLFLAFIGALLFGIYSVILKYLLSFADFWTIFFYTRMAIVGITLPLIFVQWSTVTTTVQTNQRSSFTLLLGTEILATIALVLHTFATQLGPVSIVSALYATRPIFVFLLATFVSIFAPQLFQEKLSPKTLIIKICAILLTITGFVLTTV